jgi:GGDEF domain-containing protein
VERIAQLEAELAAHRRELGEMRLQLDVLSTVDSLTGLLNRNGILDAVESAAQRQVRTGEPFGLLLITVPELRRIRAAEHELIYLDVVRDVAALVSASLRDMDRVGRVDDMTFLSVLPWVGEDGLPSVRSRLSRVLQARDRRLEALFTSVVAGPHGRVDADDLLAVLIGVAMTPPAGPEPASAAAGS